MIKRLKTLSGKGQDRGFTLIELLIVVLIVGILAAVAVPLYLGYVKDAKMVEGKSIAGAIWTSGQANSLANCGTAVALSVGYARAGLTGTQTADSRWSADAGSTLKIACDTGAYTPGAAPLFTLTGDASDLTSLKVKLSYDATKSPPGFLECTNDGGTSWARC